MLCTPAAADFATSSNEQPLPADSAAEVQADADAPTLWTTQEGLTAGGFALLKQISQSADEGLDPERYQLSALQELTTEIWHPALRVPVDQLMAAAFEQLISDLGQGILTPTKAQIKWYQTPRQIDPALAYRSLQVPGNTVESVIAQYRPSDPAYAALSAALARYRQIAKDGGWPYIKQGQILRAGMFDSRRADIESRLNISGDLPDDKVTAASDAERPRQLTKATAAAVKKFQRRHGLYADGIIGPKTLAAMNIPVTLKIDTIKINLERLRWMPRELGDRYIITNIADFSLRVIDQQKEVLSMPVVVGKEKFKTPVFSDTLEFLVVNPTWTVPKSILYRELLPAERRNPGYLTKRNFELIREEKGRLVVRSPDSIDRSEYKKNYFRYTARQKPGGRNALGKVKFIFPNKYSIYLHDTPARSLFKRNTRAFSHGCVRVGNPKALARTLLEFEGWSNKKFQKLYNRSEQTRINLDQPVLNHISYQTSWVDDDSQLHFRPDIYKHDIDLLAAFDNPDVISWPATILAALGEP